MLGHLFNTFRLVDDQYSQEGRQELAVARYQSLKKQILLLYVMPLANAWMVASTFYGRAPRALTLCIPIAFSVLCAIRLVKRLQPPTYAGARRMLAGTTFLSGALSAVFVAWGLTLHGYGTAHMQGQAAFFIGIIIIGCIIASVGPLAELDTLRKLNCSLVQGYYYSKPLVSDEIMPYLEAAATAALFNGTSETRFALTPACVSRSDLVSQAVG